MSSFQNSLFRFPFNTADWLENKVPLLHGKLPEDIDLGIPQMKIFKIVYLPIGDLQDPNFWNSKGIFTTIFKGQKQLSMSVGARGRWEPKVYEYIILILSSTHDQIFLFILLLRAFSYNNNFLFPFSRKEKENEK